MSETTANVLTYEEIKDRTLESCLKSGQLTSNAEANLSNNQGKLWSNLLGNLEGSQDWAALEAMEDVKDIRKSLQNDLKKAIEASGVTLSKGEKGNILWSKDKQTAPIMKYTSDIAKVVAAGMASALLPGDGTVAGRCGILKACKGSETPAQAIERGGKVISGVIEKGNELKEPVASLAITQAVQLIKEAMSVAGKAEMPTIWGEIQTLMPTVAVVKEEMKDLGLI